MPIPVVAFLALTVGLIGLIWSANLFVSGSASAAKHLGMTPTMIGLTIVAFGTSAPEMIVSAGAAFDGVPDMGIGNAIGSNIANIGLVLGVTALIAKIPVNAGLMRLEVPLLVAASLLSCLFLWDYQLEHYEGYILLGCTVIVGLILVRHSRKESQNGLSSTNLAAEIEEEIPDLSAIKSFVWLLCGLLTLLLFADILVWSAKTLAIHFGVSPMIIGLTVVALGTSLPELAASIASALKGHHDIALGNIVGSNILNILAVMALPGIIMPTTLEASVLHRDLATMMLLTSLLVFVMWIKTRKSAQTASNPAIGRILGLLFLAGYIGYYAVIIAFN